VNPIRSHRPAPARAFALLLALACFQGACDSDGDKSRQGPADSPLGDGQTYTVRGRVDVVSPGELSVHHEAIPTFINRQGKSAGMVSMQMPFAVSDRVDVVGVHVGDLVEIDVLTRWSARPPLQIVRLRKLPPDTELTLR